MTLEEKLDDIAKVVHEMSPMLAMCVADLRGMDARQRFTEVQISSHGIQLERLNSDFNALGNKVRHDEDRERARKKAEGTLGRWKSAFEVLFLAVKSWHILVVILLFLVALIEWFYRAINVVPLPRIPH